MPVFFFSRRPDGDDPGGVTVSKRATLPEGDFRITEWSWGLTVLWFVAADEFTADERQAAYLAWITRRPKYERTSDESDD